MSTLIYRSPSMPAEEALVIVDALRAADVPCWISGGWGVDALAGQRTRTHRDLDLVLNHRDMEKAIEALLNLGYWEWFRIDSDIPLLSRVVLHDHEVAGRVVDLHPLRFSDAEVELARGTIEGCPVPCISLELQRKTHFNYRKRWRDRSDLALLRRLSETPMTMLIVPIPSAQGLLHKSAREPGIPAHITVLYPFPTTCALDTDIEAGLASLLEQFTAFDFTLVDVGRFPGVVYLAPEPVAPFVALTRAVLDGLPDQSVRRPTYDQIIPHLTVAYGPAPIPKGLAEQLPLAARAEEVWLISRTAGRWVRRGVFPLTQAGTAPEVERVHFTSV